MIHSTWGKTFLQEEIEATDPDGLSIWYLGCNSFVVRSPETTLYIDPFFGDGVPPSFYRMIPVPLHPKDIELCDGILVTHEHLDHFHPESYGPILENTASDLYAPSGCFTDPQISWNDLRAPERQRRIIEEGDSYEIGDLTVHVRGGNDPDAVEEVSYVIEHYSGIYFNGGDSRYAEVFHDIGNEFDIDVGNLVFGTIGRLYWSEQWVEEGIVDVAETSRTQMYMDENDIIRSANALSLDRLVPCHYDMWKGGLGDPKVLHEHATSFTYPYSVEVAEVGDRFDAGQPGIRPLRNLEIH